VTGKEVDWPHIVKGYEYKKGQYVALSDADFKHANVKASETIEIASFTDAEQIPSLYFETPYYLAPSKGGQKVYSLLRRALQATKKVAVATFVMRGRQHLCVVAPNEDMLMLLTLRFASEVLPPVSADGDTAAGKSAAISAAELTMAKRLVDGMSGPFKPNQFKDTYRDDLLHRVKEKIKKKQTHSLEAEALPESDRPKAQVIDLMEALRNSLKKNKGAARAAPKKVTRQRKRA
jgi:DNA end-binding protein Ku